MAKELLIRKQKGTHSPQCTSYRIVEPSWRFTLETCDEDVTGVIKDDVGNTIATVSAGAPAIVSRLGLYNVCVTGNGMGALYVEWTSDTYVDQQCCNEVRKEFEQMLDDAIAEVERKIPSSTVTVRSGENTEVTKSGNTYTVNATDTVTTLKAGNGISLQRNGYEYTVFSKVANIVAGENVSIEEGTESDGSPRFEISAVDTKPDVTKAYVDQQIASVPRPDVDKAYVDQQIAAIEDKDTVTTLVAGTGISISDSGTSGNHQYTVNGVSSILEASQGNMIFGVSDPTKTGVNSKYEVYAGDNVTLKGVSTGNGTAISINAVNTDTVTTLIAGDNITIADSGTDGNHNYNVGLDTEIKFISEDGKTKSLVCKRGIQTVWTSDPNTGEIICGGFSDLGDRYTYCSLLENSIHLRNVNVQENKDNWLMINSDSILFMINGNQKTKLTSEFLTGLSNKTWTDSSFTSGRAATEDQLKVLADRIAALEARL